MDTEEHDSTPRLTVREFIAALPALFAAAKDTARQTKIVVNTLRQAVDAGLIVVCVSAAFAGFTKVDGFIGFAQIAFACALPFLIVGFLGASVRPNPSASDGQRFLVLSFGYGSKVSEAVGWYAAAAGVVAVIWHGNGWAAFALIPASILALALPVVRAPELLRAFSKQQLPKDPEEIESLVN